MQDLENDEPNRKAGKRKIWKITDQFEGLENAYMHATDFCLYHFLAPRLCTSFPGFVFYR